MNFPTGDFLTSKGLLSCFAKTLLKILRRGLAHTKAKEELPEALDLGAGACSLPKDRGLKKINLENRVSIFRFKIDILLHFLYAKTSTKISIFWYQNIDIWGTSFQGQNQYSEDMFVRCKPCRRVKDLDIYIYICMSYIYIYIEIFILKILMFSGYVASLYPAEGF